MKGRNKTLLLSLRMSKTTDKLLNNNQKNSAKYPDSRSTYKNYISYYIEKELEDIIKIPFISTPNYKIPGDKFNN